MGTRAQIAYIVSPNKLATITNFYDGMPDYLGNTLKTFYNNDEDAEMVVIDGPEISDINPDDGTINRYDKGTYVVLKGENEYEVFSMLYDRAKNTGSTYVYVWDGNEWLDAFVGKDREEFINTFSKNLEQPEQTMEGQEEEGNELYDWISDMLKYKSYEEVAKILRQTLANALEDEELVNKVKADYEGIEDLEKTELEEYLKRQWQHRAGIIK